MIEMGKKYQTRDGRAVRILATDMKNCYTIVGIVTPANGAKEFAEVWTSTGESLVHDMGVQNDLIPIPTKHEGWAVVDPYSTLDEMPIQMCRSYQALVGEMKREGLTVPRFRIAHVTWED